MADYFTEAELEGHMGILFTTTSTPDTTAIGIMATEISNMYDGLAQQAVGTETPDEFVTQACLSCATYTVGQIMAGLPIDPEKQIRIIKSFLKKTKTQFFYAQNYPSASGKW